MASLSRTQFQTIAGIARERWGLHLTEQKKPLVANRLSRFLRTSDFPSLERYVSHLKNGATEDDMLVFFDLLSTGVTSFFRDPAHYHHLEREFYTPLARKNVTLPGRRIRIWSAACSTGPEPYSLAINALEAMPDLASWDFRILATDLASSALSQARQATYPASMVSTMDRRLVRTYFTPVHRTTEPRVRVAEAVRSLVTIRRLNRMDDWPLAGLETPLRCVTANIYAR